MSAVFLTPVVPNLRGTRGRGSYEHRRPEHLRRSWGGDAGAGQRLWTQMQLRSPLTSCGAAWFRTGPGHRPGPVPDPRAGDPRHTQWFQSPKTGWVVFFSFSVSRRESAMASTSAVSVTREHRVHRLAQAPWEGCPGSGVADGDRDR